jgi:hypothetical protein
MYARQTKMNNSHGLHFEFCISYGFSYLFRMFFVLFRMFFVFCRVKNPDASHLTAYTAQEVHHTPDLQIIASVWTQCPTPRRIALFPAAQSPEFKAAPEWGPAIDRKIQGFLHHQCCTPLSQTPVLCTLLGTWLFSRKRNGAAKARLVLGGHCQRLGIDDFEFTNCCSVLALRDYRILLGLAAAQDWSVAPTVVEQVFLLRVLNEVDLYIHPPARYPCPSSHVLKPSQSRSWTSSGSPEI